MPRASGMRLQGKAVGLGLALAAAALAATDFAFLSSQHRHYQENWDQMHEVVLRDWRRMCEKAAADGRTRLLSEPAKAVLLGPLEITSAYLAGPDGKFLVHSDDKARSMPAERWRGALAERGLLERRAALRMPDGSTAWAGIVYPAPRRDFVHILIEKQQKEMMPPVFLANALILLLVACVAVVAARTVLRPVRALAAAVAEVSRGNFSARVPADGGDELAALGEDFNAMARRLRELEALRSDFLGKLTHDLRSPMGSILGYARLLRTGIKGPLNADQEQALDTLTRGAKHLGELVDNILDMSKIEAGQMRYAKEEVDLARLIEEEAALMAALAQQNGVSLRAEVAPGLPAVPADGQALRRVLLNLISNALKFTPEGGSVLVRADAAEGGGVRVSVRDTGIGIPAGKLGALFSKFTPIHDPKDLPRRVLGTGLGLAICKEMIEGHGGRISVESEAGKGTTVSFAIQAPFKPGPRPR